MAFSRLPKCTSGVEDRPDTELLLPRMIASPAELALCISQSVSTLQHCVSFSTVNSSKYSLRQPAYPTFTRFAALRLAQTAPGYQSRIVPSHVSHMRALHDFAFPVELTVRDADGRMLFEVNASAAKDSSGYALFYDRGRPRKTLALRSSAALYPMQIAKSAQQLVCDLRSHWKRAANLSAKEASWLIEESGVVNTSGDNHIVLLLKAYLMYFDSLAARTPGVSLGRNTLSSVGVVLNVSKTPGWVYLLSSSPRKAIVNVLGGSESYQEFWAHCCFDRPPVFAMYRSSGDNMATTTTTPFAHFDSMASAAMLCLCDTDVYATNRAPAFFGRPDLILECIELYVQQNALGKQANEALQIAMLWPTLCRIDAPLALPQPVHGYDWLAGVIEKPEETADTAYNGLISSDPDLVLASVLAGESAILSQIQDYLSLFAVQDGQSWLTAKTIKTAVTWLANHDGPGIAFDFLLRNQFHTSPSFLYLTGLARAVFDWPKLLGSFDWTLVRFPSHLRLMQAFWTTTSPACMLPWHTPSRPSFRVQEGILVASLSVFTMLLQLGVLHSEWTDSNEFPDKQLGRVEVNRHGSTRQDACSIPVDTAIKLQSILDRGIRVIAVSGSIGSASEISALDSYQFGSTTLWSPPGGLLAHDVLLDVAEDALRAPVVSNDGQQVSPVAVEVAAMRIAAMKAILHSKASNELDERRKYLTARATQVFTALKAGYSSKTTCTSFSPEDCRNSAWQCLLWLLRQQRNDFHSMASLLRQVDSVAGPNTSRLPLTSAVEVAGVCAILQLRVCQVHDDIDALRLRDIGAMGNVRYALSCRTRHWTVTHQCSPDLNTDGARTAGMAQDTTTICQLSWTVSRNSSIERGSTIVSPQSQKVVAAPPPCNLVTRARILDQAIRHFDWGLASSSEVAALHASLFPSAGLPRFLKNRKPLLHSRLQTDDGDGDDAAVDEAAGTKRLIVEFLEITMGSRYKDLLEHLQSEYRGHDDACSERWPHRSPENASKNNVTIRMLFEILQQEVPQEALALWFIKTHQGNHGEYVTSVAVWLASLQLCGSAWTELLSSGLLKCNEDDWLSVAQTCHEQWRKGGLEHCACDDCWAQVLYTPALWGRGGVQVDWMQEITSKATPPDDIVAYNGETWSAAYASELIRETVRDVMQTASKRLFLPSFDDFMDHAYEWLVAGSAAGLPSAFKGTEVRNILLKQYGLHARPTKRSVMEAITREQVLQQLQSRPQIVAKLHQKLNETGGKARAIYGVTIWHYIFSNWLMAPFEKAIDHPYIDMHLANESFVALQMRRAQGSRQDACFSSYDYPDFNSMHTHHHMSMIYAAAKDIAGECCTHQRRSREETDVIEQAYDWLYQSVFTQVCYLHDIDDFVQTVGGLYSGNRDTTLINTLLNVAYAKVVDTSCLNMGLDPRIDWRLCHGDDIITQHSTYASALAWNIVAAKAKLKGQEKKLLTDRSFHEYLRIMGCSDGKLRGTLARAVASFVNGNWETDHVTGVHARIVELDQSLSTLRNRGMRTDLAHRLRSVILDKFVRQFGGSDEKASTTRHLIRQLSHQQLASGLNGSDISFKADETGANAVQAAPLRRKDLVERLFHRLPDEVTRPYMSRLAASLPVDLTVPSAVWQRLKTMLQRSTYGTELPLRFQLDVEQIPQLAHLNEMQARALRARGHNVRHIDLAHARTIFGDRKGMQKAIQRIQAIHILLSAIQGRDAWSNSSLLAEICGLPETTVRAALSTLVLSKDDWRRHLRPSAPEVGALENEIELLMSSEDGLGPDEEVVVVGDDGSGDQVPIRSLMLF